MTLYETNGHQTCASRHTDKDTDCSPGIFRAVKPHNANALWPAVCCHLNLCVPHITWHTQHTKRLQKICTTNMGHLVDINRHPLADTANTVFPTVMCMPSISLIWVPRYSNCHTSLTDPTSQLTDPDVTIHIMSVTSIKLWLSNCVYI